jgi:hypothetical protein
MGLPVVPAQELNHRCRHFIMPQGCHERDRLPCSLRNVTDQSLATPATSPETEHIDTDRGLNDKHQSRRIKKALLPTRPRKMLPE